MTPGRAQPFVVTPWLIAGLLMTAAATALLVPLAECPECVPYWTPRRDSSGGLIPGYPMSAIPARCPLCGGGERVSRIRKWTYGDREWYP